MLLTIDLFQAKRQRIMDMIDEATRRRHNNVGEALQLRGLRFNRDAARDARARYRGELAKLQKKRRKEVREKCDA